MTRVVSRAEIEDVLGQVDVIRAMEAAFATYSRGDAIVPPVGELLFDDPPGDAHIKYGYRKGDRHFVVKVATGFYGNAAAGLAPNGGLMLMFDATTGFPSAVLLDEGHLTNVRTAAAGAVAAKHLAPRTVTRIGICGTGMQARMQVEHLASVTPCRDVAIWGRRAAAADELARSLSCSGFSPVIMPSAAEVAATSNLVITATSSSTPLLRAADIRPGTHVSAMGSDTPHKHELDPAILALADLVVADSVAQCVERGEVHWALDAGILERREVVELGAIIDGRVQGRTDDAAITVCDLTGVATQDIEICKAVVEAIGPQGARP